MAAASALVVAACASSGTAPDDDAASTVSEGASTAAAVTTSSTPTETFSTEPVAIGPATLVSGTADCSVVFGPLTTDEDGGEHGREGSANCTYTMNDPRVAGRTTDTWSMDAWTSEQGESVLIQWGTTRLETDEGGVWEGTYSGSYNENTGDTISFWYRGTGPYEGLSFHVMFTGSPPWDMEGLIYPGDLPDLP